MLREYQKSAISDVYQCWRNGDQSVLLQMPTGAGKSKTLGQIVKDGADHGRRIYVLAHREELIEQLYGMLGEAGVKAGVIKSGYPMSDFPVQVCSVQTLINRLDRLPCPNLIVTDECHHAPSKSYRKIYNHYPSAKHLGVTATPCRIDGKPLGDIFDRLVLGPGIQDLIDQGFLVPPSYRIGKNAFAGKKIGVARGDYKPSDLSKIVHEVHREGDLVDQWRSHAEGLQTIVFACDIQDSINIATSYKEAGIRAEHVDGETDKPLRREILRRYASGEITVLCNVGIFTEGLDVPSTGCVQLARPTKSLSLMYQMIGRALRPATGKDFAVILDHAGIFVEHDSVLLPRSWSLESELVAKRSQTKAEKRREEEGLQVEKLVITDEHSILVEVPMGDRPEWLSHLEHLIKMKSLNGYKTAWIAHKLKQKYPGLGEPEWKIVAKALGYNWQWAKYFNQAA